MATTTKRPSGAKKKTQQKRAQSTPDDALAILRADHRRVTELFDQFEALGDRAHKSRQRLVERIIEELSVHAGIEEATFYPAIRERFDADGRSDVLEAIEEHHVVKLLLAELESMDPSDERFVAKATVLREIVDHHVDEEEKELFREVRAAFTRSELVDLGRSLEAARATAPKRPHPNAPDTPPGNLVANVIAAPLDAAASITSRAADAVKDAVTSS
jgi:hemerythrin superfamily protein